MISKILIFIAKILLGINTINSDKLQNGRQKIYFANHSSHIDTIAIIAALPKQCKARPVAAKDYWGKTKLLRSIAKGLNCILLDRHAKSGNILEPIYQALNEGDSIIIFPEGTRGNEALPNEFKAGIYHLAQKYPDIDLIPVYLSNVYRSMPKGKFIPLPLICSVKFGEVLEKIENEKKENFLLRAQNAVIGLFDGY